MYMSLHLQLMRLSLQLQLMQLSLHLQLMQLQVIEKLACFVLEPMPNILRLASPCASELSY